MGRKKKRRPAGARSAVRAFEALLKAHLALDEEYAFSKRTAAAAAAAAAAALSSVCEVHAPAWRA